MKTKYTRILAIFLIIIELFLIVTPIPANALLNGHFNLDYTSSMGYTIMRLNYSNPSVKTSFEKLAERSVKLKNSGTYSYSSAIQILTETKSVVNKITESDYEIYEDTYKTNLANNGMMVYQYTYESFIARNVLYAMMKEKASYSEFLKAIQLIYDMAVIQSQKGAFRSDALNALADLNILASYSTNENVKDMLFYVSKFASGISGSYNGSSTISSVNIATKYQNYLDDQYDKSHDSGKVEHNTNQHESEYAPGGYGDYETIVLPSDNQNLLPDNWSPNEDVFEKDTFSSDLKDIYGGNSVGKLTLYYTLNKSDANPKYQKTKITTKQFITYEDIIEVLKTISRNSSLMYVEDSDAVLVVYDGVCSVLDKSDTLYDENSIKTLFSNLKDFGLYIGSEEIQNPQS